MSPGTNFLRAKARGTPSGGLLAAVALAAAVFAASFWLTTATVSADGAEFIDITSPLADVTHGGARFQGGFDGAGTGNFDPFLTFITNDSPEQGYNSGPVSAADVGSCDCLYDEHAGGSRTHRLLLSAVPVVTVGGVQYREFLLDSNDPNSNDFISLDEIKIFIDNNESSYTGFTSATNTFSGDDAPAAVLVYNLDAGGNHTVLTNSGNSSGSGVSDVRVLVLNSSFTTAAGSADCSYGSATCPYYVIFWSVNGATGAVTGFPGANFDNAGGFEEWRTRLLPVVRVAKTVTLTKDQPYDWSLTKQVSFTSNSAGFADSQSVSLFNGQSQNYWWRLTATRTAGTATNPQLTGTITVTNPTGATPIFTAIPASIVSVTDVLTLGGGAVPTTVSCPGGLPQTLDAGDDLVCTYSATGETAVNGTNRADVQIDDTSSQTPAAPTTYSSPVVTVDWAGATVANEIDETATLTDPQVLGAPEVLSGAGPHVRTSGTINQPCASGNTFNITNTGDLEENDSGQDRSDTANVTINCYGLTVSKTANTTLTRSYNWTLTKWVSLDGTTWQPVSATANLFNGQTQNYFWQLRAERGAPSDSAHQVSGNITVVNQHPTATAVNVTVTDTLSIDGAATVVCPGPGSDNIVDVPTGSTGVTCTYSRAITPGSQTNTATATLFAVPYNSAPVTVNTAGAVVTETDEAASISDPGITYSPVLPTNTTTGGTFTSTAQSHLCGSSLNLLNEATLTELDTTTNRTDDARIIVNCAGLTVTKTSNESFTRNWAWTINKQVCDPDATTGGEAGGSTCAGRWVDDLPTKTIADGQAYVVRYRVKLGATSTDSTWATGGTITVTNNHTIATPAASVTVTDAISGVTSGVGGVLITVDCDAVTAGNQSTIPGAIAGGGNAQCSYAATGLPDGATRTNTATATLFTVPYTGTASVNFTPSGGNPVTITETNECVNASDDLGPVVSPDLVLGTHCATTSPFNVILPTAAPNYYTITFGTAAATGEQVTLACGDNPTYVNTARAVPNDGGPTVSNPASVDFFVTCVVGCTLTQGYWKTHSDRGPAPYDDTWALVPGGLAEDTIFFKSAQTWYTVFWTPPRGGNAYYQLAHQYMAARLNILTGASAPASVTAAIAEAEDFFTDGGTQGVGATGVGYTPTTAGQLSGNDPDRQRMVFLAGLLASYNEGTIGPGHCDEDQTSVN